ncbi:sugar ABC transporter permease [Streptacidiphilus sp. PB12-B1b]|uniref:sugar ABC transporter permease n=1 Tax=Streptacidiphilus sp. PB12-B1b TaxID=2705012 RepID=UPI0015FD822B|nr:sugar ABC transporter permease [Streptacidiphilus sp. PB12-B1b]QMU78651.1 sugar ABC transporter permease [Streptacidiphilus sp. PB12-B1b]
MSNDTTTQSDPSAPQTAPAAIDPRLLVREEGIKGYIADVKRKISGGELGSLPVVVGLIVIWIVFGLQNSKFLQPANIGEICFFLAATGMAALGLIFVLILGEIDLSVLSVSGLSAAVFGWLAVVHGINATLAVLLAIGSGVAIGALQGFFFAKVGVPAFVVTLAGNLGWFGVMLWLLGSGSVGGSITLNDSGFMHELGQNAYFLGGDIAGGYLLAALAVAAMLGSSLLEQNRRRKAGVPFRPTAEIALRTGVLAVVSFAAAYELNQASGVPMTLVFFLAALVICDLVLRRTSYGRKIFAVGGSIEAARRAGISVPAIRISVFAISGGFGALSGLFYAGWSFSAQESAGQGAWLMLAIAAAVIGGTSLFGGRGKAWSALLGMLVIQSITTGLQLLGLQSDVEYMITAVVLLAAVVIDSVSRRTQKSSGRA